MHDILEKIFIFRIYTRISAYSDWIQSYMGRKINKTMPFIPARSSASKIKSMGDILAVLNSQFSKMERFNKIYTF